MAKIFISFATEFFVSPEMDDTLLKIIKVLDKRGITGSFHLTGERARVLRARGRKDIIKALKKHEIGYHTNTHGSYPFLGEICENQSWDDAVSTILATEARGILDIEDIFDTHPKYFVSEFIKAPQLIYAMRLLGIDLIGYSTIPASGNPFAWFAGSLCYTGIIMGGLEQYPSFPGLLLKKKENFDDIYLKAKTEYSDSIIKLILHPYKIMYSREALKKGVESHYRKYRFYAKDWIVPAKSYGKKMIKTNIREFGQILDYIKGKKGIEFISTSESAKSYKEANPESIALNDVFKLSKKILQHFTFIKVNRDFYLSPAEIFGIFLSVLAHYREAKKFPGHVPYRKLLGPVSNSRQGFRERSIAFNELLPAISRVMRDADFYQRIPSAVKIAGSSIPPEAFLLGMAETINYIAGHRKTPRKVIFKKSPQYPEISGEPYFQENTFVHGNLYPEGFTGKKICRYARMQAWSYKPAVKVSGQK